VARPEPFLSIDAGIVEALADAGITCYPYEGTMLPGPLPLATCVMDDGAEAGPRGSQQRFKLGRVPYVVRYYTSFDGAMDPSLVWEDAYTGLAAILTALGSDPTLGGRVASVIEPRASITGVYTRDGAKPELMVEVSITVCTAPY